MNNQLDDAAKKKESGNGSNDFFEVPLVETWLHRKKGRNYHAERLSTADKAVKLGRKLLLRHLDREYVYVVALDAKMEPLSIQLMSIGSMDTAIVDPARILTYLLLSSAHSFILFHNHVSGDTTPSNEDIQSTKRIKEAAKLVGIKLQDHIIIGEGFTSMKEQGFI